MPNKKNYSLGLISPVILVIFVVLIVVVGIYIVIRNQQNVPLEQTEQTVIPTSVTQRKTEKTCQLYGFNDKKNFLPEYIVKAGDTLLYIAKKELGSTSRVNEIIELNRDRYPSLSMENPFIEQGWILFLPPPNLASTNGKLLEYDGQLSEIKSDGAWVITEPDDANVRVLIDKNVNMIGKTTFEVGDCVRMLYQPGAQIGSYTVFSITSQD